MAGEEILIIDDNPTNLKLARIILSTEGYAVRTANDAEEALRVLASFKPRLILMDIQLPVIDGLEPTRQLKLDPATKDIVIVALSAYAMKGDQERAFAAGCDGYITKPVESSTLAQKVAEHMARVASRTDPEG